MSASSTTTIDLVRHADVHNPQSVFYGRLPRFGLSQLGREQAGFLGQRLAGEPIVALYTSPMLRARQTSRLVAERLPGSPPVRVSRDLIEVGSQWQGRPGADLDAIGYDFYRYAVDGDESIADVFARMRRLVYRLAARHGGQHVVCVSHADPIAIVGAGLRGKPLVAANIRGQADYPAKTSITRVRFAPAAETPTVSYEAPSNWHATV